MRDISGVDGVNRTPLMWAAFCGHLEVMKLLVEANADLNGKEFPRRFSIGVGGKVWARGGC
jgi:ankyrin repeat protein